jgi:hypothetical protein
MIDQALGLDDIEAQINAGGTDIQNRQRSLQETDGSLAQSETEAERNQRTNQSNVQQARAREQEATDTRSEAEQLLSLLREQATELETEEQDAVAYLRDFRERYGPYFEFARTEGDASPAGASPGTPAPVAASGVPASMDEGRITELQLLPVEAWIAAVRQGDETASAELAAVDRESENASDPASRAEERAATALALGTFQEGRSARSARLDALLTETRACVGLSMDEGMARLSSILDRVLDLAHQVESERSRALGTIGQYHLQAMRTDTPAPSAMGVG